MVVPYLKSRVGRIRSIIPVQFITRKVRRAPFFPPSLPLLTCFKSRLLCFLRLGDLIAKHRKVHLFDIDIPGKQTFKESETLTGGTELSTVTTEFGKIGLGICYDIVRRVFLLTLPRPTLPHAFCSSFFFISLIPRVLPSLPIVSPRTDSHTRHKNPYLLFLPRSRPALTYSNTRRRNTIALQRFPEMAMIAARQGCIAMIYPSAFK